MSDTETRDRAECEAHVVTYVDRLWGPKARGWACLGIGRGPHYDENGKYKHDRYFERFFSWPNELEKLIKFAVTEAWVSDVYVTPALRTAKSRKKNTAAPGSWLWVDVDGEWCDEREQRWQRFTGTGSFMVLSGRGRHLYVPAGRELEPAAIEAQNRKLAALFRGEKWEANALLRMPGTQNWKTWAAGGEPAPVSIVGPLFGTAGLIDG